MLCYWGGGGGGGGDAEAFNVEQGVAQGCSLSPILFSVFINGMFVAVEQAGLGIELSDRGKVGGLLFADFVGVSESGEQLQRVLRRCGGSLLLLEVETEG